MTFRETRSPSFLFAGAGLGRLTRSGIDLSHEIGDGLHEKNIGAVADNCLMRGCYRPKVYVKHGFPIRRHERMYPSGLVTKEKRGTR